MDLRWTSPIRLAYDLIGALSFARGLILSREDAIRLGASRENQWGVVPDAPPRAGTENGSWSCSVGRGEAWPTEVKLRSIRVG